MEIPQALYNKMLEAEKNSWGWFKEEVKSTFMSLKKIVASRNAERHWGEVNIQHLRRDISDLSLEKHFLRMLKALLVKQIGD